MQNPHEQKVFCIGMFKTGTTTMGKVFELLGMKTFNGPDWSIGNDPMNFDLEAFLQNSKTYFATINDYQAFQDYPFMYIYPWISDFFPNSKFVLTLRDPLDVARSDINMWRALGKRSHEIPDETAFVERYIKHRDSVLSFFGNDERLLQIEVGNSDDLQRLQAFLGHPKPQLVHWPRANKGTYGVFGKIQRNPYYWKALGVRDWLRGRTNE